MQVITFLGVLFVLAGPMVGTWQAYHHAAPREDNGLRASQSFQVINVRTVIQTNVLDCLVGRPGTRYTAVTWADDGRMVTRDFREIAMILADDPKPSIRLEYIGEKSNGLLTRKGAIDWRLEKSTLTIPKGMAATL